MLLLSGPKILHHTRYTGKAPSATDAELQNYNFHIPCPRVSGCSRTVRPSWSKTHNLCTRAQVTSDDSRSNSRARRDPLTRYPCVSCSWTGILSYNSQHVCFSNLRYRYRYSEDVRESSQGHLSNRRACALATKLARAYASK